MIDLIPRWHWRIAAAWDHPGFFELLGQLRREKALSSEAWRELNGQRLRQLLAFSRDQVPYYSKLFAEHDFNPDSTDLYNAVQQIPVLTKEAILANREQLIAGAVPRSTMFENSTGGSTGTPLSFWQDQRYSTTATAIDAYVRQWWGVSPFARTAAIWGADREFHELSLRERFYCWRHRHRSINAFRMTEPDLRKFCQVLRRWRPPYLMGYASALDTLARFAKLEKFDDLRFVAIRSAAEMLWPQQRQRIESVFQSPVYNFYGSREVNNLAAECPEECRLHLISTWRYVEIVDDRGRHAPDGELGYVCVTDLSNHAMPFIRYRNEDLASFSPHPCPCGRPSPVLERLMGRTSDVITTAGGELIHGEFFTHLFYGRQDVRQFQVHQTSLSQLTVRYVPAAASAHEFMAQVRESISKRMGVETEVRIEACDVIPLPPSGKHRFTISDVPLSLCGAGNV